MPTTHVQYRLRDTGEVITERIYSERLLRWFYERPVGRIVFTSVINRKFFCDWYGRRMDEPKSAERIPAFVEELGIDVTEAERPIADYASFNAFFSRRLKPDARPFDPAPDALVAAGDGKLTVYPLLEADDRLPIKGTAVSPLGLLGDPTVAARYRGGSALVLRLAPYDYHRFHFPDGGTAGPAREIPGGYHSVNPIALARVPDLFCRNKRMITLLESDHAGCIALVEVGAITIGTIIQTYVPGRVERGDEKGYFRYGGSTVVVLFEPGAVTFDADLIADAAAGLEVAVKAGTRIGTAHARRSSAG